MGAEIDTEKVRRIVAETVALHQAQCPAVKDVAKALQAHKDSTSAEIQGLRGDLQRQHEENLKAYHETEKALLKGDAEFKEHGRRIAVVEAATEPVADNGRRIGAVENVTRHITEEIEAHKESVTKMKDRVLVGLLKIVVYLVLGGSGTAAILQAFGLLN